MGWEDDEGSAGYSLFCVFATTVVVVVVAIRRCSVINRLLLIVVLMLRLLRSTDDCRKSIEFVAIVI